MGKLRVTELLLLLLLEIRKMQPRDPDLTQGPRLQRLF
jgi:hypothetical protein